MSNFSNSVPGTLISGTNDNDSIVNYTSGSNVTIDGGTGNDTITNEGEEVLFIYNEGDGTDVINGFNSSSTLQIGGGTGTYSTQQSGSDIIVNVGDGKITLQGAASSFYAVNIAGVYNNRTEGDDTINNFSSNVTIDGYGGNDNIFNSGNNVLINGGAGNDKLYNGGYRKLAPDDCGNSYVGGSNSTLNGEAGDDEIFNDGGENVKLSSGADNDNISNSGNKATIDGGSGNDHIFNYGEYYVGSDGDGGYGTSYKVVGNYTSINGGDGSDTIENILGRERIFGEYYTFSPDNTTIEGGAGNDSISNDGSHVTISGGKGDDTIINNHYGSGEEIYGGQQVLLVYNEGDGNDYIEGFDSTSTLQIGDGTGTCSIESDGANLIVHVGEGKITLAEAAEYIPVIKATSSDITGTEYADNIANLFSNVKIEALGGDDEINNFSRGYNVTIDGGAGADNINNGGSSVSIEASAGNDTIYNDGSYVTIAGGTGDDSIENRSYYGGENIVFVYNEGDGNDIIDGFRADSTLQIGDGTGIYSTVASGNDIIVYVGSGSITLTGAASLSAVNINGTDNSTLTWTLNGTTATYGNLVTVSGVKSVSGISLNGKTVTVANSALNNSNVSVSNGYNLALANEVPTPQTTVAGWSLSGTTATYKAASTSAGYKLSNNQIAYTAASGGETFTVSGVKSTNGISLSGKTVTVANSALNNSNVTISNGYNLALANDVPTPQTTAANWSLSGTTATYKAAATSAGYKLADNKISYVTASGGETFTVSGVKSLDGLSLNKKVITVSKASLGTSKVTVSDGYTIKLADDVTAPSTKKAWSLSGTTATYKQTTGAGYTLDDNAITYTKKSTKNLATVKGVKSTKGLSISDKVITVSKASLGTSKVSISGTGYTLKLGSDVVAPATKKAAWSLSDSTATYKSSYKTAGYKLASNGKSIAYSKATTRKNLATVKGVKSTKGLSVSGKVVTVSKASLGTSKVSISGTGYTLKLGKDVTAPKSTNAWSLSGTTATYKQTTGAGYTLDDNAITYSKKSATNLATIKGAKSKSGLKISGNKITLKNSALSKKVTVSGGYEFDFAKDYSSATITGSGSADTVTTRGSKVLVNGGKGDDTIKILGTGTVKGGAGSDVFYYKSSGANVIGDYAEEDTISIASGKATTSTSGDDLVLTVGGKGKITVVGGKSKTVTYVDAGGEHIYKDTSGVKFNAAGTGVTLTADYSEDVFDLSDYPDYKNKVTTINAAKVKHSLEITGNKNANKITGTSEDDSINGGAGADLIKGGAGNDSLWGNKGNDTLYGGDGDDTFIYHNGNGNDVIADFEIGDRIQVIAADIGSPIAANGDVTFAIGSGKLVIKGGADKLIQLYGENGGALSQKYKP